MALLDVSWQNSIQKNLSKLVEEAESRVETAGDRAILRRAMEDSLHDQKEAEKERRRRLFDASREGNLEEVELLYASGPNIEYTCFETTSLAIAVKQKHLAVAEFFLENGMDVNTVYPHTSGQTLLLLVAESGDVQMLSLLLRYGAEKSAVDTKGKNAVHLAAMNGNVTVLEELLRDAFFCNQQNVDKGGVTPFLAAAGDGQRAALEVLLRHYPDHLNGFNNIENYCHPPLCSAVSEHHSEATKFLLSCPGIEIERTDYSGRTALLRAASGSADSWDANPEMLDFLRKAGANVKHQSEKGYNALAEAIVSFQPKTVSHLLTWDDIDINVKSVDGSPLCIAAQKGRKDMVQMLLDKKPDLDVRDDEGKTALALAAQGPSDYDKWRNAGRIENEQAYKIVVRKLLKAGIPIDVADHKGRTPLMIAASEGHAIVVEFLLQQRANIDAEDEDGETAIDFAKQKKHAEVVLRLEEHQKKTFVCSKCKAEETR